jgi:hypothetical protein
MKIILNTYSRKQFAKFDEGAYDDDHPASWETMEEGEDLNYDFYYLYRESDSSPWKIGEGEIGDGFSTESEAKKAVQAKLDKKFASKGTYLKASIRLWDQMDTDTESTMREILEKKLKELHKSSGKKDSSKPQVDVADKEHYYNVIQFVHKVYPKSGVRDVWMWERDGWNAPKGYDTKEKVIKAYKEWFEKTQRDSDGPALKSSIAVHNDKDLKTHKKVSIELNDLAAELNDRDGRDDYGNKIKK